MFTNKCKMVRNPHINANDQKIKCKQRFLRACGCFSQVCPADTPPTGGGGIDLYVRRFARDAERARLGRFVIVCVVESVGLLRRARSAAGIGGRTWLSSRGGPAARRHLSTLSAWGGVRCVPVEREREKASSAGRHKALLSLVLLCGAV